MLLKSRGLILCLIIGYALFFAFNVRNATAQVAGGLHDLSLLGGSIFTYMEEENPCIFCHTPHKANTNQTYTNNPIPPYGSSGTLNGTLLWSRAVPQGPFKPYTSDTYTFKGSEPQPGIFSLLCLSCHDGVGALNILLDRSYSPVVGHGSADQFGDFSVNDPQIGPLNIGDADCSAGDICTYTPQGPDLSNDHPIGFLYSDSASSDPGIYPTPQDPTVASRLSFTLGKVECNTCHDPHRTNTQSMRNKFLVIDNTNSALCLSCHNK